MDGIVAAFQGFAGQDADTRYTQTGKLMVTFSVGVTTGKPASDGEKPPLEWVRVTCWEQVAEDMQHRVKKGVEVYCEGKLTLGRWEASDGAQRSGLNLSAWVVQPIAQVGRRVPREARQASGRAATRRAVERATAD